MPPGMENLSSTMQFMFWGLLGTNGLLVGVSVYFLKRYVDRKDKKEDAIVAELTAHDKRAMEHALKIEQVSTAMKNTALEFKRDQLEYQRSLNAEILSIRKEVLGLQTTLHEANSAAATVSQRLGDVRNDITRLYETVQVHQTQLAAGAETMSKLRETITTVLKKLGPNATLITTDKNKDPNKP